jgi:hypothetical protein
MTTASEATQRVADLIALTEALSSLFERENEALDARRPGDLAPLQEEKARLAAAYAQSIREIAADRGVVAGAGGALLEKLRTLTRTFEERAEKQAGLLDGARRASEGVLKAVAQAAARASASPAYGGNGAQAAAPLAVNSKA